jgi:hypothetical protein
MSRTHRNDKPRRGRHRKAASREVLRWEREYLIPGLGLDDPREALSA